MEHCSSGWVYFIVTFTGVLIVGILLLSFHRLTLESQPTLSPALTSQSV